MPRTRSKCSKVRVAVPGHASKVVSDAFAHAGEAFWDVLFGKREAS
jgi:hypothetical protein